MVSPAERGIVWVAEAGEWGGCGDREEFASHGSVRSEAHILFFCRLGVLSSKSLLRPWPASGNECQQPCRWEPNFWVTTHEKASPASPAPCPPSTPILRLQASPLLSRDYQQEVKSAGTLCSLDNFVLNLQLC